MPSPKTDFTNIKCYICGVGNLTSNTARRGQYVSLDLRGKWACKKCYEKEQYNNSLMKQIANRRTGNLDPNSTSATGDMFQELTCTWRSTISTVIVEDLNKKLDNYNTPIDHSWDSELGFIQTKGCLYDSYNKFWLTGRLEREWEKKIDSLILYCASKDKKNIERIYIFPKKEIIGRYSICIVKNPLKNGEGWYGVYRIKDENVLNVVDSYWKEIVIKG